MNGRSRTVAVVVNWNGWPLTAQCLSDLAASSVPVDVVIVDSGSTDDSVDRLRQLARPGAETIFLSENRGFAAALNVALNRVGQRDYDFVWWLNNDVRIPAECHHRLLLAAQRETVPTVWTPALVSESGDAQHVGGIWALDGSQARLVTADAMASGILQDAWLSGTALFCRVSTAARIGPFDESYFAYWEDVDWSFRATRAGVRLRVAREACVTHLVSRSSGGAWSRVSTFLNARNEVRFLRRHVPVSCHQAPLLRVVARQLRWALLLERQGGIELAEAALAGLLAGLADQDGPPIVFELPRSSAREVLRRGLVMSAEFERAAQRVSAAGTDAGPQVSAEA